MTASEGAPPLPPRAAFVAALEFALLESYDDAASATAPQRTKAAARPTGGLRAGRLGELVALCSVIVVLAGTAATAGPGVATASTPTLAAVATDTATPAGAEATPISSEQP